MTSYDLNAFLALRELPNPITRAKLNAAVEASGHILEEVRDEGGSSRRVDSGVLTNEGGKIVDTSCHYSAEDEGMVDEHADLAGLPVTTVTSQGSPLPGE